MHNIIGFLVPYLCSRQYQTQPAALILAQACVFKLYIALYGIHFYGIISSPFT